MDNKTNYNGRAVYVVDGARTPFLKARNQPGPFTAADLAVAACRPLLARQPFNPDALDEIITGCAMPSADEANISRVVGLRLGCGKAVPAFTVQRNCGSGMQAIDNAALDISSGRHDLILAGGVDAMSHAPLVFKPKMVAWFGAWMQAKSFATKLKVMGQLRPSMFAPIIALMRGLTDPIVGLSMGQTAEELAYKFHINRLMMDEFAMRSHLRLAEAQQQDILDEVETIYDNKGNFYCYDDGVRPDSSIEKLGKLKPFFDRKFGSVTPGNSSQITDGAAFLILASADAIKKYKLPVLGRILDANWAGLDPAIMGLGPVQATTPMLLRNGVEMNDIDYWEINEAFAAQVLACLQAWNDKKYCKEQFDLADKFGKLDQERLNIHGGAICMGHPIGASGARIVLQLLKILRRKNAKKGVATLCIGGGQGGAMLLENVEKVAAGDK